LVLKHFLDLLLVHHEDLLLLKEDLQLLGAQDVLLGLAGGLAGELEAWGLQLLGGGGLYWGSHHGRCHWELVLLMMMMMIGSGRLSGRGLVDAQPIIVVCEVPGCVRVSV
jgi:hypothetical protein